MSLGLERLSELSRRYPQGDFDIISLGRHLTNEVYVLSLNFEDGA